MGALQGVESRAGSGGAAAGGGGGGYSWLIGRQEQSSQILMAYYQESSGVARLWLVMGHGQGWAGALTAGLGSLGVNFGVCEWSGECRIRVENG